MLCAGADPRSPQQAGEEEGAEGEDCLEGGFDAEHGEDKARGVREEREGRIWEVRGWRPGYQAPEVGVVHEERFEEIEGQVPCYQGPEICAQEGAAGEVCVELGAVHVEGGLWWWCGWRGGGVGEELGEDGGGWGREDGETPGPGCAAEVAEEVEDPVEAFDEGGEGVGLPGEGAGAVAGAGDGFGVAVLLVRAI